MLGGKRQKTFIRKKIENCFESMLRNNAMSWALTLKLISP